MAADNLTYIAIPDGPVPADLIPAHARAALDAINRRVAAAPSLDRVMDLLYEATRDVCPCDRVGLAFIEDDGARVVSRWVRAEYQPILLGDGYGEDMAGSSLAALASGRKVRVIRDLAAYLEAHPNSRSSGILIREGVRSSMTCPLVVDGRAVALLFRSARVPDAYGADQVAMHLAVGERLAQAVEKAWRIRQLEEANRAYTEMLGFVAHELKSPVASMMRDSQMMLEGYAGELAPAQAERLRRMVTKGEYLLGLVGDYLSLARLEGDLALDDRDGLDLAGEVIDTAVDMARADAETRGMTIEVDAPRPMPVQADPDLMRIAAVNLVGNGVKYGRDGGRVRVVGRHDENGFSLKVHNEGPGFPESQRGRLFRRFSRLDTAELRRRKGTGVGLYTVARIVRLHGGRVFAESQEGAWAEFGFSIPQPLPDGGVAEGSLLHGDDGPRA